MDAAISRIHNLVERFTAYCTANPDTAPTSHNTRASIVLQMLQPYVAAYITTKFVSDTPYDLRTIVANVMVAEVHQALAHKALSDTSSNRRIFVNIYSAIRGKFEACVDKLDTVESAIDAIVDIQSLMRSYPCM